jgi:hypothetical protein
MHNSSVKYVISIFILAICFLVAIVFGLWAFSSRSDYKDHSDKKVAAAVKLAEAKGAAEQQAKDAEADKQPYKTYTGSLTYGGVTFNYPKTWSGLVDTSDINEPINGYFHPDVIPGMQSKTPLSLRVELLAQDYASVVQQVESDVQNGAVKAIAYIPPSMDGVANVTPGIRLDGQITQDFQGSMVIIKVRDKTLEISTQSNDYLKDFNDTVLASLTFVP